MVHYHVLLLIVIGSSKHECGEERTKTPPYTAEAQGITWWNTTIVVAATHTSKTTKPRASLCGYKIVFSYCTWIMAPVPTGTACDQAHWVWRLSSILESTKSKKLDVKRNVCLVGKKPKLLRASIARMWGSMPIRQQPFMISCTLPHPPCPGLRRCEL